MIRPRYDSGEIIEHELLPGCVLELRRPTLPQLRAIALAIPPDADGYTRNMALFRAYARGIGRPGARDYVPGIVAGWRGMTAEAVRELFPASDYDTDGVQVGDRYDPDVAELLVIYVPGVLERISELVADTYEAAAKKKSG